jgi:putative hydrolase of the HAD superfamily
VIKTVIFDLGGVIVPLDFKRGYAKMEPLCGYPAAEIPQRLRKTDLVTRYEIGAIESPAFVAQLSELLGMKVSYSEFCELWSSIFLPETLIQEPLLQRIRERHRLLLLSNTNDIHFSMIERTYPILRLFDDRVLSYKVGASKPTPRIYEEAIVRAGCRPEECVFIDDVPAFVEGARKAGIDAVQFESQEQVERELGLRGVL